MSRTPAAIVLSGRTEADNRATAVARTSGSIVELRVKRGSVVKKGDIVAVLSDEAREAMVTQARRPLRAAPDRAEGRASS